MYIKVKEMLINFDKVCFIKQDGRNIIIYFVYAEGSQCKVMYDTENDAQAAYKAIEKLLVGKE